ncbi:lytic transglycosylase domain-containing protein [Mesorhizobium mediterraneum]|uniref:Transglycosylase SLT domain-containing protein n=1 Tax=Mesorhizobium mediterraneum TaxID=43617 RepID=A0AB36R841_9HYPH|nr:lytic transglycosylase domain-containing protein [Mesorhizobium mediterraneum]PAQ00902.1 hypothetical protein CIT25_17705 [Mesorhizobium mediterraneum]WIW52365.1 lytic transglycosylase domain-containing protein [Mesorhizobium mediterraneum]
MPKLPGLESLSGQPSGRSGRPIATYDGSAIGRGAAQLGGGAQSLASNLKVDAKRQEAEVDQATAFETQRRFLEFTAKQDDALVQAGQKAKPGAFGFRESYTKEYKDAAKEFFASVPEPLKGQYDVKLFQTEDSLAGRALTFERDQRKGYYTNTVNDGLTKIETSLYKNPAAFDQNLVEGNKFIDSIPDEDVSPIQKEAMRREWKSKAQLAALYGLPPEARVAALGGGEAPATSAGTGDPVDTVVSKIIGVESGGNPNAKNPTSSASGVGQFLDSTWVQTIRQHRPDIAAGKSAAQIIALKSDPVLGREMTKAFTQDNAEYLTNRGIATTPGNIYLAHFLGSGGVVNVLKADPGASIASVVGQDVVRANSFLAGKSVADTIAWANKKMGGKAGSGVVGTGPVDPRFDGMPWDQRSKIIDQAETKIRQDEAERRVSAQFDIENAASNAPISIQNTGVYTGAMPSQDQFIAAYGDKAAQKFAEFQDSLDTSQSMFKMRTMPADEIASLVESAEPTSTGDNAAAEQKRYDTLSNAASSITKAREADPATYVRQAFPVVNDQWNNAQSVGNYQSAVAASIAAQQQIGIQNIQPLPKAIAAGAVDTFKNDTIPQQDRIAAASSVIMATPDPAQRQILFNQMVAEGLPDITQGAFEALSRGDHGAANRLFQAAMVDPTKLAGAAKDGQKPADIDLAVQDSIMDDGQIGDLYYGLSDGTAENYTRAQRDSKLINNAVNLRLRNGETMDAAIAGVSKDLYGDVQAVTDANVQILVPKDQDAGAVVDGLQAALPDVRTALTTALAPPSDAPTADGTKAIMDAVTRDSINRVMSEGYFRNSADGYVFIDPYVGAAIADEQGNPIIFKPKAVVPGAPSSAFQGRTPEPGGGPSLDENGNPVVLQP